MPCPLCLPIYYPNLSTSLFLIVLHRVCSNTLYVKQGSQRTRQPRPLRRMLVLNLFVFLHYSCLCSCLTSLFPSFLPSRRSLAFMFFKTFLAVLRPPGSLLVCSVSLLVHCLNPCMHVRFSGCGVISIVIPYYSK